MAENLATLKVVEASNQFTTNLYKVLSGQKGNVFFSPISVYVVLSMAYQGARDTTAQQFAKTLGVPEAKIAREGFKGIINRLNSVEKVTLHMANKIYLMEGLELLNDFASAVTKHFLSDVQLLNFGKNAAAAKTINTWVEKKTCNKINNLIQADALNNLTRLVLVNAIYFKGSWLHKFDKKNTRQEPFYLNYSNSVNVQMMHIKKEFKYKRDEELDVQILELPYTNRDLSMIIILPNKRNGLDDLEKKLATTNLSRVTNGMWKTEVDVTLPKFKVEQTTDLEEALTKLGLGEIFDSDKANFRGMIDPQADQILYVSKVVQKAFIEVNEEGAEAAAATSMIVKGRSKAVRSLPPTFRADHPFIFVLAEKRNNLLFVGRLHQPN